jgi:hypothetical protein
MRDANGREGTKKRSIHKVGAHFELLCIAARVLGFFALGHGLRGACYHQTDLFPVPRRPVVDDALIYDWAMPLA